MRLLICTQAVDRTDQALGFFHGWIAEFAHHFESIQVICLKEGEHELPKNVSVHSLGKESGASWVKYISRFYTYILALLGEYDAVFVHMNQEYVLLGGLLWRLFGKRVVLWRNHKRGSTFTRIAGFLSNIVCHTSPEAFVSRFRNAHRMPIGIDTELFKPGEAPAARSVLFLGRLDPVKHVDIFIAALAELQNAGVKHQADIVGDPTYANDPYAANIRKSAAELVEKGVLSFHKSVQNRDTPALYRSHAVYVNVTPSGSFDKTIGEALASGCIVVAANEVLRGVLPDELIVDPKSVKSVAAGIRSALMLGKASAAVLAKREREYTEREHSLSLLVSKLVALFAA